MMETGRLWRPSAASWPVSYAADPPYGGWMDAHKTDKQVLRKIPAGTFTMGSPAGELGRSTSETQHPVTLTKDFFLGVFEVTQRQWELAMGRKPSYFTNAVYYATRPVEQVSCYEIRYADYCRSALRDAYLPDFRYNLYGFRACCAPPGQP